MNRYHKFHIKFLCLFFNTKKYDYDVHHWATYYVLRTAIDMNVIISIFFELRIAFYLYYSTLACYFIASAACIYYFIPVFINGLPSTRSFFAMWPLLYAIWILWCYHKKHGSHTCQTNLIWNYYGMWKLLRFIVQIYGMTFII